MDFKINTQNYILLLFLFFVIIAQVYSSNKLATVGAQIDQLETQAQKLEDENRKLLAENVSELSLSELKIKAQELGFVEPELILNLSSSTLARH